MHTDNLEHWQHDHTFLGRDHAQNEGRTWIVVGLTAVMMVGEILAGIAFGSMALLADGFHMATHAGALSLAGFAYWYARRHADDDRFSFGTGKLGELAGYTSAVILAIVALMIGFESILRLAQPISIRFNEAIAIATLGLIVNLISAWILHGNGHSHGHEHHNHDHHDHPHGHDHNLRSAYFHVLTDALTSVLAILALVTGKFYGWLWMDPIMGIVGSLVIAHWSWGLLQGAGAVLLDMKPDHKTGKKIAALLENNGDRITDLHLWRVGPGHTAAVVAIVTHSPRDPGFYKAKLAAVEHLSHVTIEVQHC